MQEVVKATRRVTDIVGNISWASTEQSDGVAQVDALNWITDRAPALRATLGASRAGQLQAAVDGLDFQRAIELLTETPAPDAQGLQ